MHRFYLAPNQCHSPMPVLSGAEAHHALRVLRVKPGERVAVLDGDGQEIRCEVVAADKRTVRLRVLEKTIHAEPQCQITLLQAIPKGKILESIIEKATELGVHRIVPLLTERVTTRLNDASAAEKGAKWQHVAVEAIKQCGAAWLPKVAAPVTLKEFLARKEEFHFALVGSLQPDAHDPRELLRKFVDEHGGPPRTVAVWIGPEGDFTSEELNVIQAAGARAISLGPLVLRVETAAVYCLSFLNYELQSPFR